jgi:hypothetical protein
MKEITLKIPDTKFSFFMELVKQLGIEVDNKNIEIPEEHKNLVRERIKTAKQEDYVSWEDAREQLKFKTKSD